jgi:hypothetical protein
VRRPRFQCAAGRQFPLGLGHPAALTEHAGQHVMAEWSDRGLRAHGEALFRHCRRLIEIVSIQARLGEIEISFRKGVVHLDRLLQRSDLRIPISEALIQQTQVEGCLERVGADL